jgi:hypothetical protein
MAKTTKIHAREWVLIVLATLILLSDIALAVALNHVRNDLKQNQLRELRLEACYNDNTKPCDTSR